MRKEESGIMPESGFVSEGSRNPGAFEEAFEKRALSPVGKRKFLSGCLALCWLSISQKEGEKCHESS